MGIDVFKLGRGSVSGSPVAVGSQLGSEIVGGRLVGQGFEHQVLL